MKPILLFVVLSLCATSVFARKANVRPGVKSFNSSPSPMNHMNPSKEKCQWWKDHYYNVSVDNAKFCAEKHGIEGLGTV
jgi:hypothetical protein